jgi:hypothetical protein
MSDGPYKTMKMSRPWKGLAKIAANPAHSVAETAEAFQPALLSEWSQVRPAFAKEVRTALGDNDQGNLFTEVAVSETQRLQAAARNPVEALLAAQASDVVRDGELGSTAYEAAIKATLDERALHRSRQMEEHYLSEGSGDAGRLRHKLHTAIPSIGTDRLAAGIAAGEGVRSLAQKVDRSGLEDGPIL